MANKPQIRREWIIHYLKINSKIDNQKIREKFQINLDTATRDLNSLIIDNRIMKQGQLTEAKNFR